MKTLFQILKISGFCLVLVVGISIPKAELGTLEIIEEAERVTTLPEELSIPRLNIRAPIEHVGITDGDMAVPNSPETVGWYSFGTKPGDTGSAVLAGHVNWWGGRDAVFTNLQEMQVGDLVNILNEAGSRDYFIVRDIQKFPLDADTSLVFSNNEGKTLLNLITCYGTWNEEQNTHEERLVIFTEKI